MSKKKTTDEFIKEAKKVHGDKYDYSKAKYVNWNTKICIICSEHGIFWQMPGNHLKGHGCPKCSSISRWRKRGKETTESFVSKVEKIHNFKYNYSKVKYINCDEKICIICPEHGEFWQTPYCHIKGQGCPKCAHSKVGKINSSSMDEFVRKSNEIHNDKYDYSKVEYINNKTPICIICSEHGEFLQTPDNHLHGKGCPKCSESHLEKFVRNILDENNVEYCYQKRFEWLGKQSLDFYLPEYNIAIECQGRQHFEPVDFAGNGKEWAEENFSKIVEMDNIKLKKVNTHNIEMIYLEEKNKNNLLKKIEEWKKNGLT